MKHFSILLSLVVSLSLMGCGSNPPETTPPVTKMVPPERIEAATTPITTPTPVTAPVTTPTPTPAPVPTPPPAEVPPVVDTTPTPVSISISGFKFGSGALTVKKGTKVTWTNNDSAPHNVVSTDGSGTLNSDDLAKGDSFSFTFSKVGTFTYKCSIHPSMTGTVTVE